MIAAINQCRHPRLSIGLDRAYCPDCKRGFMPKSAEYKAVLECRVTPEQTPPCSGVTGAEESTPEQTHWTETYSPSNRKSHTYYRYLYMEGQKLRHIHIPGGSALKPSAAQHNWLAVERAIAMGKSPLEICELIKSWKASS